MHYRRVLRTGDPGPAHARGEQIIVCKALDCDQAAEAKAYCHGHYLRLLRNGQADESPLRTPGRLCSVDDCGRPHKAKGYCAANTNAFLPQGTPNRNSRFDSLKAVGVSVTATGAYRSHRSFDISSAGTQRSESIAW
jgi:hypothetical protein